MKKSILFFLTCASLQAGAQGFFNQQATKEQTMAQQIAGIGAQLQVVKSGYDMTENGLNTVHELKNGTFSLHQGYFSSLQQVSPAIQSSPKGKAITDLQQKIRILFTGEINWQQQQKFLHPDELSYIQLVYNNLLTKCQLDLNDLADVLTPGKLQMTDAQRLARLDHLYAGMNDKFGFAVYFTTKCRRLALQRRDDQQQNGVLKQLYGINP